MFRDLLNVLTIITIMEGKKKLNCVTLSPVNMDPLLSARIIICYFGSTLTPSLNNCVRLYVRLGRSVVLIAISVARTEADEFIKLPIELIP
jgi:hypothetical protein